MLNVDEAGEVEAFDVFSIENDDLRFASHIPL